MRRVLSMMWNALTGTGEALRTYVTAWRPNPAGWDGFTWVVLGVVLVAVVLLWWRPRSRARGRLPELLISHGEVVVRGQGDAVPGSTSASVSARAPEQAPFELRMTVSNLSATPVQLLELAVRTNASPVPSTAEVAALLPPHSAVDVTAELREVGGDEGRVELYVYAPSVRPKTFRIRARLVWEPWNARFKVVPLEQHVDAVRSLATRAERRRRAAAWRRDEAARSRAAADERIRSGRFAEADGRFVPSPELSEPSRVRDQGRPPAPAPRRAPSRAGGEVAPPVRPRPGTEADAVPPASASMAALAKGRNLEATDRGGVRGGSEPAGATPGVPMGTQGSVPPPGPEQGTVGTERPPTPPRRSVPPAPRAAPASDREPAAPGAADRTVAEEAARGATSAPERPPQGPSRGAPPRPPRPDPGWLPGGGMPRQRSPAEIRGEPGVKAAPTRPGGAPGPAAPGDRGVPRSEPTTLRVERVGESLPAAGVRDPAAVSGAAAVPGVPQGRSAPARATEPGARGAAAPGAKGAEPPAAAESPVAAGPPGRPEPPAHRPAAPSPQRERPSAPPGTGENAVWRWATDPHPLDAGGPWRRGTRDDAGTEPPSGVARAAAPSPPPGIAGGVTHDATGGAEGGDDRRPRGSEGLQQPAPGLAGEGERAGRAPSPPGRGPGKDDTDGPGDAEPEEGASRRPRLEFPDEF